ncbi:hypothetical protein A359_05310 [secondary endosymbiont of Ctenarytaina eucalypti]|uniref:Uncharacterized protein n=1 Tax=secondary endosymbiont of Ctenarytaina eucalypti TaxID=1199245 RepID=J3YS26_9ENTR|nr:hypothetical protein A359_05310 [secondary endosymbiont of Ctenarytaina eucalypti]
MPPQMAIRLCYSFFNTITIFLPILLIKRFKLSNPQNSNRSLHCVLTFDSDHSLSLRAFLQKEDAEYV